MIFEFFWKSNNWILKIIFTFLYLLLYLFILSCCLLFLKFLNITQFFELFRTHYILSLTRLWDNLNRWQLLLSILCRPLACWFYYVIVYWCVMPISLVVLSLTVLQLSLSKTVWRNFLTSKVIYVFWHLDIFTGGHRGGLHSNLRNIW